MIRVRICTMRCRCHNSCRRSRFSPLGTQILGKRFSISNCRICCASCRSVFCLRSRFPGDLGGVPDPQLEVQFRQESLKPACMPTSFHSHSYLLPLGSEVTIKLFCSLTVL